MKCELSSHAIDDRAERITNILLTIGVGNILYKIKDKPPHKEVMLCISDTGVLIIKDISSDVVITMYAMTTKKLYGIFESHFGTYPPQNLLRIVRNNEKKRKFLYE